MIDSDCDEEDKPKKKRGINSHLHVLAISYLRMCCNYNKNYRMSLCYKQCQSIIVQLRLTFIQDSVETLLFVCK